ncbi:hypothetical protein D9615_007326 [Tricholomella constricta]|uniref:Uncharacterized protein n=1 Tax=Tricholomella constricta TaxID=117010 RepID=A0A8H5M1A7_9AGAR|nr:hypothetical protein D9615_007326 [Tricholomella constricta]
MSYSSTNPSAHTSGSPVTGRLRPALFPSLEEEDGAKTPVQSRPHSPAPYGNPDSATHWTLEQDIEPSKYQHLLRLPHKLSATNYITWTTMIESTLDTVDLFDYCQGLVPKPDDMTERIAAQRWKRANAQVRAILTTNMTEEVVNQLGHHREAAVIWLEAQRLFAGRTLTDWTLTITSLVTTKYVDGDDLPAHIARMKGYRRDLIMMQRDIDDDLYACFLRISMPSSWNYVFAGLPAKYTSSEDARWGGILNPPFLDKPRNAPQKSSNVFTPIFKDPSIARFTASPTP